MGFNSRPVLRKIRTLKLWGHQRDWAMRVALHKRIFVLFFARAILGPHVSAAQATFDSPETAVRALLAAVRSGNFPLFLSIAGPGMSGFWGSGDEE